MCTSYGFLWENKMSKNHLLYREEYFNGFGNESIYRINGVMTLTERNLIQDALELYKIKLNEEACFSKILKESKTGILNELDNLINKFNTLDFSRGE